MKLLWHGYRYYAYEKELALREVATLFPEPKLRETPGGLELRDDVRRDLAARLTYVAKVHTNGGISETHQSCLENTARKGKARQATRYSVHGLHEYKGKFNPQVAKALLNMFGIMPGQRVLDPFCGSGTALVECVHVGATGYGVDINPLAVFVSNAKLQALATPASDLWETHHSLVASLRGTAASVADADDPRTAYLRSWFALETLQTIEMLRCRIESVTGKLAPVFLTVASNLLRDYSQQDPKDMRIRRRKSPLPSTPLLASFHDACRRSITRIEAAQSLLGEVCSSSRAVLGDTTVLADSTLPAPFDAAITSPPYAMALPYVDTQRLSLVWLKLGRPDDIPRLEAALVGSREFRGQRRNNLIAALEANRAKLPEAEVSFCRQLVNAVGNEDGFRRQAVPILLYRYFCNMRDAFRAVRQVMRRQAPFGLIVGCNHSVLGGTRHDIETPAHLANLAASTGWAVEEELPLQTYKRYGYHVNNAIARETLVVLRAS